MATPIAMMGGNTIAEIVKTPAAEIITREKAAANANLFSCLLKNPGFFAILDVLLSGCSDSGVFMLGLECSAIFKGKALFYILWTGVK